jgi:hypothetical protein
VEKYIPLEICSVRLNRTYLSGLDVDDFESSCKVGLMNTLNNLQTDLELKKALRSDGTSSES